MSSSAEEQDTSCFGCTVNIDQFIDSFGIFMVFMYHQKSMPTLGTAVVVLAHKG